MTDSVCTCGAKLAPGAELCAVCASFADSPPPGIPRPSRLGQGTTHGRYSRKPPAGAPLSLSAAAESSPGPSVPDGDSAPATGLTATYARALERLGQESTPQGVLILHMASMLEFGFAETLSAKASMARALMTAWNDLSGGAAVEQDALDEISKKRREKFGA